MIEVKKTKRSIQNNAIIISLLYENLNRAISEISDENIFVEDFTLKHLLHFEIYARETCCKFVYKHSATIE